MCRHLTGGCCHLKEGVCLTLDLRDGAGDFFQVLAEVEQQLTQLRLRGQVCIHCLIYTSSDGMSAKMGFRLISRTGRPCPYLPPPKPAAAAEPAEEEEDMDMGGLFD